MAGEDFQLSAGIDTTEAFAALDAIASRAETSTAQRMGRAFQSSLARLAGPGGANVAAGLQAVSGAAAPTAVGGGIGGTVGGIAGGVLGSVFGPAGTAVGMGIGTFAGQQVGSLIEETVNPPKAPDPILLQPKKGKTGLAIDAAIEQAAGTAGTFAASGIKLSDDAVRSMIDQAARVNFAVNQAQANARAVGASGYDDLYRTLRLSGAAGER